MSGAEEGAGYGATQEQALPEFGSTQQPADAVGGDGGELPRRDLHLRFLDARGSSRPSGIAGWYLVADGAGVRVGRDGRCDVVLHRFFRLWTSPYRNTKLNTSRVRS